MSRKGSPREEDCAQGTAVMGMFEVDLFPEDVNSTDHPRAREFRKTLEAVARDFQCRLLSFDVDHGTVSFAFDSDELNAEILRVLEAK
jgi:hypothetical protein